MKSHITRLSGPILAGLAIFLLQFSSDAALSGSPSQVKYIPVTEYDPKRNAAADIEQALREARRIKKHVLLEVGGKWCVWCTIMDQFFQKNPDILRLRDENYITLKINFSPENENKGVLSRYPRIPGYPHLFVLDGKGNLLHSQFTADLEEGESYNRKKFVHFLKSWAPARLAGMIPTRYLVGRL